jgi:hypothetical protein
MRKRGLSKHDGQEEIPHYCIYERLARDSTRRVMHSAGEEICWPIIFGVRSLIAPSCGQWDLLLALGLWTVRKRGGALQVGEN